MQVHNAPTRNVRKASSQPNPSAPNRGRVPIPGGGCAAGLPAGSAFTLASAASEK